jgi:hypothetical protein
MRLPCDLVEPLPLGEDGSIFAAVSLTGRDIADTAVAMLRAGPQRLDRDRNLISGVF